MTRVAYPSAMHRLAVLSNGLKKSIKSLSPHVANSIFIESAIMFICTNSAQSAQ